jgi:hypothetical protein
MYLQCSVAVSLSPRVETVLSLTNTLSLGNDISLFCGLLLYSRRIFFFDGQYGLIVLSLPFDPSLFCSAHALFNSLFSA